MMNKILEKFLRKRKQALKTVEKYRPVYDNNRKDLAFYCYHGFLERLKGEKNEHNLLPWEYLSSQLTIPKIHLEGIVEAKFVGTASLDRSVMYELLKWAKIECAITYRRHRLAPERFNRELSGLIPPNAVFSLAIAVILKDSFAEHFFQCFKEGYSKGWINRSNSHMTDFMILLYGAYKGESIPANIEKFAYQNIIDNWDTPDTNKVEGYIKQLCDDQVEQVASPPSKDYFEYSNSNWQFIPYPALMFLKIRKQAGLENPVIEHEAFGNITEITLVDDVEFKPDNILAELQGKLSEQGFDINNLFKKET